MLLIKQLYVINLVCLKNKYVSKKRSDYSKISIIKSKKNYVEYQKVFSKLKNELFKRKFLNVMLKNHIMKIDIVGGILLKID